MTRGFCPSCFFSTSPVPPPWHVIQAVHRDSKALRRAAQALSMAVGLITEWFSPKELQDRVFKSSFPCETQNTIQQFIVVLERKCLFDIIDRFY